MKILDIKAFRGRNIYSHHPVIQATIDLEELELVYSDEIPGFAQLLFDTLPQLESHHCSRGKKGGFMERVREGTLIGHIIEHIALELQHIIGHKVIYGKTRSTLQPGIYEIVVEVELSEVGIAAVHSAVRLVEKLLKKEKCDIQSIIEDLKKCCTQYSLGPSTQAIIDECVKRDIPVLSLGEGSLFQLGYGIYQKRIQAAITSQTSCIGVDIASNKHLTKSILRSANIPVPQGDIVFKEQEALKKALEIGFPVVIKPYNGQQGKGVSIKLSQKTEICKAFQLAQQYSKKVIVEKYIEGKQYRLLVVGNKMVAAAERKPAHIIGDGVHTILQLIEFTNQDPLRGEGHELPLTKIRLDETVLLTLAKNKLNPHSVPDINQVVFLRENANLSTGGTAADVTAEVDHKNKELAVRIAKMIGLDIAGIDIVTPDISVPLEKGGAVIEVNAAPGLRMHLKPNSGKVQNVASDIVEYLYPANTPSKIPIIAVTGTNGKTTTTRLSSYILSLWKNCVGMTTTGGVYIGDECIVEGDTTGAQSAQMVLKDERVEAAVLETARGGILRCGLGYDKAQVGVITNISEDHLGLGGIEEVEQMAKVKALVVEALEPNGTAVLNADDPNSREIMQRVKENLILFSLSDKNILIRRHLATGQKAFFIKNGYLVCASGDTYQKVAAIKDIPFTLNGLAKFNVANALAAVAACYSIGVPVPLIKQGLLTFGSKTSHNPGRCQLYEVNGLKVILDYGHNPAAFENVLGMARKMKKNRLIGVIGVPGDRRNQDIIYAGKTAGRFLDYCILKEDRDLRGRATGEVVSLLYQGLGHNRCCIVLHEIPACIKALSMGRPGDVIVMFYEKLQPLQMLFERITKNPAQESVSSITISK